MFGKKNSQEQIEQEKKLDKLSNVDFLICPYCERQIKQSDGIAEIYPETNMYYFSMMGCPHCKKVLGCSKEY